MNWAGSNESLLAGVVVIGRNEGDRLRAALASVCGEAAAVVYVDSGSTDGSADVARLMGAVVHELDPARPFSAARARREGVEVLAERWPGVEFIQFVDGDCALEEGWIDRAVAALNEDSSIGVVCGMLAEASPEASIYNRMCDLQWRVPAGEVASCGGIFMIRRDAYEHAGGFNAALLTREERDLCQRVRQAGFRIMRIDAPMAEHDAGLLTFGQWWSRAVWGGYGDAIQIRNREGIDSGEWLRRASQYLLWPMIVPFVIGGGLIAALWSAWFLVLPVIGLTAYGLLFGRVVQWRSRVGDTVAEASLYASLSIVRWFPVGWGFLLGLVRHDGNGRRPDPHAAAAAVDNASGDAATDADTDRTPVETRG